MYLTSSLFHYFQICLHDDDDEVVIIFVRTLWGEIFCDVRLFANISINNAYPFISRIVFLSVTWYAVFTRGLLWFLLDKIYPFQYVTWDNSASLQTVSPERMLTYRQLDCRKQTCLKFESKYNNFHFRNVGCLALASVCQHRLCEAEYCVRIIIFTFS